MSVQKLQWTLLDKLGTLQTVCLRLSIILNLSIFL